jgi:hypothetical protein
LAQVDLLSDGETLEWLNANSGPRSGPDDGRGLSAPFPAAARPQRLRYAGKAHFDLSLAVPIWFDDDCLSRLIVGRRHGNGVVMVAELAAQDTTGIVVESGHQAATVRLATLLPPQDLLVLRLEAEQQVVPHGSAANLSDYRHDVDRRLATIVARRQTELRQMAFEWLLAHGCTILRRQQ